MNDNEVIESVLSGKNEDFGILVNKYSGQIFHICFSICNNTFDAEDATQEAFLDAFRYLASLNKRESFYPWLCAIARRKTLRQINQRLQYTDIDEMTEYLMTDDSSVSDDYYRNENSRRIAGAIEKMSEKRRVVCEMFFLRKMKISEIAKKLSIPENTVKSRIYDVKAYLRKELKDMEDKKTDFQSLEERINKKIKAITLYYSLNGGKYDEGFGTVLDESINLVDKIKEKEKHQYYLSQILQYKECAETDDDARKTILKQKMDAAESGRNAAVIADSLIDEYFGKRDSKKRLEYLEKTAFPALTPYEGTDNWKQAMGVLSFWHGRSLLEFDRFDEARTEFRKAADYIEPSEIYHANAISAIREMDDLELNAFDRRLGLSATADGLVCDGSRVIFNNQPGFSEDGDFYPRNSYFDSFLYFASMCNRVLLDSDMKPGDKITSDKNKASLTCISKDEAVSVSAGVFPQCLHMRTEVKKFWRGPYVLDAWYALGTGLVKVQINCEDLTEKYELTGFDVAGGKGYLPFCRGNRWSYSNPDDPEYVYHKIERSVDYYDGILANISVSSALTLKKDFEKYDGLDSKLFLQLASTFANDWKLDSAVDMLKKAVRTNIDEEAVQISLFGLEVLSRFAEYCKNQYRFCQSHIGASTILASEKCVKYDDSEFFAFGPYSLGKRGRYEDRIFGIKPFRYLDEYMDALWDEKWVPGYREEADADDDLKMIFTVEEAGRVSVPAGTFDNCRKVTIRVDKPEGEDDSWYFRNSYEHIDAGLKEYWFAPGVGIVKIISVWGEKCDAECLLTSYNAPASAPDDYFPIQIGNSWEYEEPHLTAEGYRAKALFRIASGMNGEYLMLNSQEFIYLKTEEEYNEFAKISTKK